MKIQNKKLFLFFCLSLFLCGSSFAQVMIDNSKTRRTIKPGDVITDSITVTNTGKSNAAVRVYIEDFRYVYPFTAHKEFLRPGTLDNSCSQWVNFSPQDFTLAPGQVQAVAYSVKVPANINDGGYYAVLFFESVIFQAGEKIEKDKAVGAPVSLRLGYSFFLETENKFKETAIEDIKINKGKLEANFITSSNVALIPKGSYYIMSEDGMVAARGKTPELYLDLEARAPFSIELPKKIADGKYTMMITFDLGDSDALYKEIELSYGSSKGYQILKVNE